MSGTGKPGKPGSASAKNGPPIPPSVYTVLSQRVKDILREVNVAQTSLSRSKKHEKAKDDFRKKLDLLIESLDKEVDKKDTPKSVKDYLRKEIAALREQISRPNLPTQPGFPQQVLAREKAAQVVLRWGDVTPGVSLNDLPPDARELLQACTMGDWSPFQSVLHGMIRKLEDNKQDPKVITARLNFAIALFQAMVPRFCGRNIPDQRAVEHNRNEERGLLECIARAACNKSEEDYSPMFVFAEAAFQRPGLFFKDAAGVGFALGVLVEMVPTAVGLAQQVPSALFQLGKYMVTNPLASFTTCQVAEPYITSLLTKVFGDRFGPRYQGDRRILDLFDELSEYYLREGVTDIIGFPPADIDSILNRLNQILYHIGYRGVAGLQSTAGIVEAAKRFPAELCQRVMSAGTAINRWLCDNGMRLLERYKFIPQGTEEGLFERILAELSEKGLLENPHINACVVAYLKHNKPTTVFSQSLEYVEAEDILKNGPLLSAADMSESLNVDVDSNSEKEEMEELGDLDGSGRQAAAGEIFADPNKSSSDAKELGAFRVSIQPGLLQAHSVQSELRAAEEAKAEEEARRLAASAQVAASVRGGDPLLGSIGPNLYPGRRGGRSRSRKRSVSKRTRRKGVAKKQNSKKNKRQSRRKVHRASSRKGRK